MKIIKTVSHLLNRPAGQTDAPIALRDAHLPAPQILNAGAQKGYLAGQLLVATPVLGNGCFHKAVVYVFAHGEEGAMGLIVNQPLEFIDYGSLLDHSNLPPELSARELPLYFGGPVERARGFVLHGADYQRDFTLATSGELAVTASSTILTDLLHERGPRQAMLCVGHAGWGAGQLEAEIEQNSWITLPATPELIFGTDNELKWATASQSVGVNMAFFSHTAGHA